ncbi:MAG: hypothetical protein GY808_14210, partial [Gammaproteobacteria bacterium]|nr:hypothetical protein [Gammaproteobacteria bacterium]
TVTLEGETDHSGVKVALYRPVVLDTALVRINQQYPNIGVQISQETEFDHREHSPLYSTNTNASGAWKIEDVTPGTYNVVAEKDSFGWQVEYEKQTGNAQFDLYKNILLTSMSNSTYTFESGRCYIISMDVYLQDMTTLNFEANSKIIFTANNDLEVNNSTLSFPSAGWVHITSD